MELVLDRKWCREGYSIGRLYVDGKFFCNTLEDKDRGLKSSMTVDEIKKIKVYGETAIPKGTYTITVTYSPRFKRMLPLLNDVKGFAGVRIHSGNTAKDTLGCILVGDNKETGKVLNSRATFNRLYPLICTAINKGLKVTLTIK